MRVGPARDFTQESFSFGLRELVGEERVDLA
jgi:hypothetical protein